MTSNFNAETKGRVALHVYDNVKEISKSRKIYNYSNVFQSQVNEDSAMEQSYLTLPKGKLPI